LVSKIKLVQIDFEVLERAEVVEAATNEVLVLLICLIELKEALVEVYLSITNYTVLPYHRSQRNLQDLSLSAWGTYS
jgi:hypothetical protein